MQSFPFTSQVTYDDEGLPIFDRATGTSEIRSIIGEFFSEGVFPNPSTNCQVVAYSGMQTQVTAGSGIISDTVFIEESNRVLTHQSADTTYDRIDLVVARFDDTTSVRNIDYYITEGTPASSPVSPTPQDTTSIKEIGLAQVFISANSTTISQEKITDVRLDTDYCGWVLPIQEIDTDALFDQLQDQVDENIALIQSAIDETLAGQLQTQIDDIETEIDTMSERATLLWENPSPTSSFSAQTITLSEAIENFNYYEIEWKYSTASIILLTSGKIPISFATRIDIPSNKFTYRDISSLPSGTSIVFSDARFYTTYAGTTTTDANTTVIPYRILGYTSK